MIKRTDANHKEIINQIRQIPSASVFSTHELGKGFPDIVVGYRRLNYLFEIKDGKKTASQKKLTEAEVKFHRHWNGQVHIVEKIDDVFDILKIKV
jgi:hypothetical protein